MSKNYGLMNENLKLQETMTNSTKLFLWRNWNEARNSQQRTKGEGAKYLQDRGRVKEDEGADVRDRHPGMTLYLVVYQTIDWNFQVKRKAGEEESKGNKKLKSLPILNLGQTPSDEIGKMEEQNKLEQREVNLWIKLGQGIRNIRKSAKVVTMSLEGEPPPTASASDSLGVRSWPPPSSDSLGVRTWPPIVSVIHHCFSSEGHQIRGVT